MKKRKRLRVEFGMDAMVVVGDFVWGSLAATNALVKVNIHTGEMEMIASFPEENIDEKCLHSDVFFYNDILIFVPYQAKNILLYNISTMQFDVIKLRPEFRDIEYKFQHGAQYNGKLYLFPCKAPVIIKMELDSLNLEYLYEPIKKINEIDPRAAGNHYFDCLVHENEYIYAGCGGKSNDILKYSLQNDTFELISSEISINGIGLGFCNKDCTIVASYMEPRAFLKIKGCIYQEVEGLQGLLLYHAILYENNMYLFGFHYSTTNTIQKFDLEEKKLYKIGEVHEGIHKAVFSNGRIYAVDGISSAIYEINVEDDSVKKRELFIGNEKLESVCKENEKKVYYEPEISLDEFLNEVI